MRAQGETLHLRDARFFSGKKKAFPEESRCSGVRRWCLFLCSGGVDLHPHGDSFNLKNMVRGKKSAGSGNPFDGLERPNDKALSWSCDIERHAQKRVERNCEVANKTIPTLVFCSRSLCG